jgi:hypothetical protein
MEKLQQVKTSLTSLNDTMAMLINVLPDFKKEEHNPNQALLDSITSMKEAIGKLEDAHLDYSRSSNTMMKYEFERFSDKAISQSKALLFTLKNDFLEDNQLLVTVLNHTVTTTFKEPIGLDLSSNSEFTGMLEEYIAYVASLNYLSGESSIEFEGKTYPYDWDI